MERLEVAALFQLHPGDCHLRSSKEIPSSQNAGWSFSSSKMDRTISTSRFSSRNLDATNNCAFCSSPGRLGIWTRLWQKLISSSRKSSTALEISSSGLDIRLFLYPQITQIDLFNLRNLWMKNL